MELLTARQTPLFPSLDSLLLEATLADSLRTVLRREGVSDDAEISLVLCDDAFIQGLNAQYRGLDRPTDVLSFGQGAPPAPRIGGAGGPPTPNSGGARTPVDGAELGARALPYGGVLLDETLAPPELAPSRSSVAGSRAGGASSTVQGPLILGDVVISLPTAARQAERAGWPLENELVLLAVHGCLHLLGYDDETADGAARMQRKAALALSETGIPPPVEGSHPFFVEYP